MPDSPEDCARRAEKCRQEAAAIMRTAERTHSPETREQLLKVAANWLLLAEEIERTGTSSEATRLRLGL